MSYQKPDDSPTREFWLGRAEILIDQLKPRSDGLFSQSYKHEIYRPLYVDEIEYLEKSIDKTMPLWLKELFSVFNGFSIFYGSLSFNGLACRRSEHFIGRYPVDLRYGNVFDIPSSSESCNSDLRSQIRLGFYSDGPGYDVVVFSNGDERVALYERHSSDKCLRTWKNITEYLEDEVSRFNGELNVRNGDCNPINPLSAPLKKL